jgi:hypothetical protein
LSSSRWKQKAKDFLSQGAFLLSGISLMILSNFASSAGLSPDVSRIGPGAGAGCRMPGASTGPGAEFKITGFGITGFGPGCGARSSFGRTTGFGPEFGCGGTNSGSGHKHFVTVKFCIVLENVHSK